MQSKVQRKSRAVRLLSLVLALAAALPSFRCEDQSASIENRAVYLIPMAVGNLWNYERGTVDSLGAFSLVSTETERIYGDTLIGRERWFGFSRHGYRRNRLDGVWQFLPAPFLEFPMNMGDSVLQGNGITYLRLISKNERVAVPAGTFVCFEYSETNPSAGNTLVKKYFVAPSLGLVQEETYDILTSRPSIMRRLVIYELK